MRGCSIRPKLIDASPKAQAPLNMTVGEPLERQRRLMEMSELVQKETHDLVLPLGPWENGCEYERCTPAVGLPNNYQTQ